MYEVVLRHGDEMKTEIVKAIVFAEAATKAYSLRTSLGLDWKIMSVRRIDK
tara:strand:- start:3529 stop:3681 length:153 start_codon:yes stop_codon:yes gene_type:complete